MQKKRIVIFASGNGSNAQKIIEYFKHNESIKVVLIISNKSDAKVLSIAEKYGIKQQVISKKDLNELHEKLPKDIDLIVLAGFLLKIPEVFVKVFPNKIINIHPSLLPNFGGKGMYGMNVHEAVIKAKEKESGITIHYVNEYYDEGEYITQEKCILDKNETPETLALKVRLLEHKFFAKTIEKLLK